MAATYHSLSSLRQQPGERKRHNITIIFNTEDQRKHRLVSLTSAVGKVMAQILLKVISRHLKDKKVTEISQYGFTKGKLHLINLIAFHDEMTGCVDRRTAVDVVHHLDCSKAFNTVSHRILIAKLVTYRLED